jgi:hypothetical protein
MSPEDNPSAMIPNKEQIYDAQINPLMDAIITICKEHKIAMVATFHIPTEEDADLHCTSILATEQYHPSDALERARKAIFHKESFAAFTISTPTPARER